MSLHTPEYSKEQNAEHQQKCNTHLGQRYADCGHTPGPWFYSSGAVWADQAETVCIARRDSRPSTHPQRSLLPTTKDSNMRLIAKAPEMYGLLVELAETGDEGPIAQAARALLREIEGEK